MIENKKVWNMLLELEDLCGQKNIEARIDIIGSVAINFNGIRLNRLSEDIDSLMNIQADLKSLIDHLGKKYSLPNWLNDDPTIFEDRSRYKFLQASGFQNLKVRYADLNSLRVSKIKSFLDRGHNDPKDLGDLKVIGYGKEDIDKGLAYFKDSTYQDMLDLYSEDDLKEHIDSLLRILNENIQR